MYEYKVLTLAVRDCEKTVNQYAKEGWRVAAQSPDIAKGMGIVVTLERQAKAD